MSRITREDIFHQVGQILDGYRFEPKTADTVNDIKTELTEYFESLGSDWRTTALLYHVDDHSFLAVTMIAYKAERMEPHNVRNIWAVEPKDVCPDTNAFERAMSVIN